MPINRRLLEEHLERMTGRPMLTLRQVTSLLATSLRLLDDVALPLDSAWVTVEAENSDQLANAIIKAESQRTIRQQRHQTHQQLSSLMEDLSGIPYSPEDSLNPKHKQTLAAIHGEHKRLCDQIRTIAEHDVEPVNIKLWKHTEPGRRALARAVQAAQDKHGTKPSEQARRDVARETGRDMLERYWHYMDEQFPTNQPDDTRPTLTERESVMLGQQLYEAMAAQEDPKKPNLGAPIPLQLCQALVGPQNTHRYNLPLVEGIATPEFWETLINQDFKDESLVPSYEELRTPQLRDRLPPHEVLKTLMATVPTNQLNAVNPVVRYLDSDSPEDQKALLTLGRTAENTVAVIADANDQPVIVTLADHRLTDHLLVTAPQKRHQVVYSPDTELGPLADRARHRRDTVCEVAGQLEPNIKPADMSQRIAAVHSRWKSLMDDNHVDTPATLQSELQEIHNELKNLALGIRAPGYYDQGGHRENAKALVMLAMLTGHNGSTRDRWRFQTPNGTNTRSSNHPPALRIMGETQNDDGTLSIKLQHLNEQGKAVGHEHTLRDVDPAKRGTEIAKAAMELSPDSRDVGRQIGGYKGLLTFTISKEGEAVQTGHWLDHRDRAALTESSPLALTHADLKKQPLFLDNEVRTQTDGQALMDAAVYLIHGDTIDWREATWAADMAGYDGDYVLKVDMQDMAGSPKIQLQDVAFFHASCEDIKRHMIQQVALSGHDSAESAEIIRRIRTTPWSKAEEKMAIAFEEVELAESSAPGM